MTETEILAKIQHYCAYQDRCSSEVMTKLHALQVEGRAAQEILLYLKNEGFVDDERYIDSFIRGKMNSKLWGKAKIRIHLLQKSLPASLIDKYLNEVDDSSYEENLQDVIDKWVRQHGEVTAESYPKLYRHLLSKGYSYELISKSVKSEQHRKSI